ncbi:hypothetical protein QZH41_018734, partial [Actinostola sp. cb2023]
SCVNTNWVTCVLIKVNMAYLLLASLAILSGLCVSRASLIEDYDHFAALDPDEKIKLYWSVDKPSKTVSFALDAATAGWVGFGISTGQGKMNQADMVIGWVKNGKVFLTDRHGDGHYPKLDDHNDYKLISGEESNGRTILKFSRMIDTCDKQDRKLEYSVPAKDTTYHCSVHKIPDLKERKHVVRTETVVQPGNEGVVHHIIITVCDDNLPDHLLNTSYDCNDFANMPLRVIKCRTGSMVSGWAIGGGPFNYPDHVGLAIGSDYIGKHFVMEIHYDNPDQRNGKVKGLFTLALRENILQCNAIVLQNSPLPDKGIKLFASALHTHLAGRAVWTQHVRDGVELPEIARDDNYDFNFQDIFFLKKEIDFKPGDDFIQNCIYNTMDRSKPTY